MRNGVGVQEKKEQKQKQNAAEAEAKAAKEAVEAAAPDQAPPSGQQSADAAPPTDAPVCMTISQPLHIPWVYFSCISSTHALLHVPCWCSLSACCYS